MFTQAADSQARITPGAIHDTVAAIVQQDEYQRRLARSLAERFWVWMWDQISTVYGAVAGSPAARTVALIVAGLLIATIVLRIAYASRFERRAARIRPGLTVRGVRAQPTLADAQRLAAEQRFADAIHVLYAAVLDVLAQQRVVRPHLSKTSGDFVSELRARGHPSHDPFRIFVRHFDRLFYGYDVCDAASFDRLYAEAERVVRAGSMAGAA
ncbi:MAG: DUF4129 domain-containing protein [Gemmatimonadota bacterium]